MNEYPEPGEKCELHRQKERETVREIKKEVLREQHNSELKRSKDSPSFGSPSLDEKNVCGETLETNDVSQNNAAVIQNCEENILPFESLTNSTSDFEAVEVPAKKPKTDAQAGTTSTSIPKWPFLTVTTESGEKLYLKINHDLPDDLEAYTPSSNRSSKLQLTETPFSKLKVMAEEILMRSKNSVVGAEENALDGSDL